MSTAMSLISAPEFSDDRLTEVINIPPYKTGRIAQLGLFVDKPIRTTYVRLGIKEQELTVIPARERGGEPNLNVSKRDLDGVEFHIPHFPLDDTISPADIQNLVSIDGDVMEGLSAVYVDKLDGLRLKHDFTHSHLDWGAVNGKVFDGEGKLVVDIFDKFEIDQHIVEFDLNTASADIAETNRVAKAILRKELRGAQASGARVLAGVNFYDRYVGHASIKEALKSYPSQTANPARDEIEDVFTYSGLTLERIDEEYQYRRADGTLQVLEAIDPDQAILVPLGTQFFKRYIAPPDTISGANRSPTPETKVFISTEDLKHDKGREIHTESNVLPICGRPQLIIRLKIK